MKVSIPSAPFGLVIIGAAALLSAVAPARAQETPASPLSSVEGLVTVATDAGAGAPATLTVHSAFVGDVVLTVNANTHFRKAGGEQEGPEPMPGGASLPAVQSPSLTGLVGLFARATYDSSHVAAYVVTFLPEPDRASGVVDSASATDLVVDVEGQGKLDLTLGPQTVVRLDGLPSTWDKLAQGDRANVLFWPTASANEALSVDARTPPPLQFEGVVTGTTTDDGGAPIGFNVARGSDTMSFQDTPSSQFWLDGKTATAADLKKDDFVRVSYKSSGGVNDALTVWAYTANPDPPVKHGSRGEHHGTGNSTGGSTGGDPSGTPATPGSPTPNNGEGNHKFARPHVAGGVVASVDTAGNTFTLTNEDKTLTFTVDSKTTFQINDTPAMFKDLQKDQHVYVLFQSANGGNLALKVLIHQPVVGQPVPAPGGTVAHP